MLSPVQNGSLFLIQIIFDLYLFILILRLLFQYTGINFYNPVAQFVVKITQPVLAPLQKFIPTFRGVDFAVLTAVLILDCIKIALIVFIKFNLLANPLGLIVWTIGDFFNQLLNIFFFAILLQVIFSWIRPQGYHPASEILHRITSPIMRPIQRLIPPVGGFDISPIPAIILIKLIEIMVANPIMGVGLQLAVN